MEFELHLERTDGTVYIERFTRQGLDEAWSYAASFIMLGEYKRVLKMVNLSAVREISLRGKRN